MATNLYAVHEALTGDMVVYKACDGSNAFQCKPKHHIFWAVATIQCDNFSSSNAEILQKPVADSGQAAVKLKICPCSVFENEKELVRSLMQRLVF